MYVCLFAIHDRLLSGNILLDNGFRNIWQNAPLFRELREPAVGRCLRYLWPHDSYRGGCMAAKSVYSLLISASEKGVSVSGNVEAFAELGFALHVIGATGKCEISTTVMG